MKKIMFCIDSLRKGGAERVVSNLTSYLSKKEYEIEILTVLNSKVEYDIDKNVKLLHLDQNVDNVQKYNKGLNKIISLLKRLKKAKKVISQEKPDVIISFLPYASFISILAEKNVPVIVSVRNDPQVEYQSKVYNILMRRLYPKASGFVYQTEDAKEYFKNIVKSEYKIIPNPINEEFIVDSEFKGKRKKEIVTVGRLYEQKNHILLIEAFADISKELKDYNLIIYGEGYEREKLENRIVDLGLKKQIFLPGNEKNVKSKIYDATLFVLSSDYEGMPNALMEAMALGVPVISTNCPCGGPKFLIKNDYNGILIDVNNKEQLKEAILKIINDESFAKKISHNSIKISEELNPKKISETWEEFIKKYL